MKKIAITLLILSLAMPSVNALVVVPVPNSDFLTYPPTPDTSGIEDTYQYVLEPRIFTGSNGSVTRATVSASYDFSGVPGSTIKHVGTTFNVSSVTVGIDQWVDTSIFGAGEHWIVDVNGTYAVEDSSSIFPPLFGTFDYQTDSTIGYIKNATMAVPADCSGHATWSYSTACTSRGFCLGSAVCQTAPSVVSFQKATGLFFVAPKYGSTAFQRNINNRSSDNGAVLFWLANVTNPQEWSVTTSYPDGSPASFVLKSQFYNSTTLSAAVKNADAGQCGRLSWFQSFLGVCPTPTAFLDYLVSFVPNVIGSVIDGVTGNNGLGSGFARLGTSVLELAFTPLFLLSLLILDLPRGLLVFLASVSGAANLMSAETDSPFGNLIENNKNAFKGIWTLGRLWVATLWHVATAVWDMIARLIFAIASFVGGIIP